MCSLSKRAYCYILARFSAVPLLVPVFSLPARVRGAMTRVRLCTQARGATMIARVSSDERVCGQREIRVCLFFASANKTEEGENRWDDIALAAGPLLLGSKGFVYRR